MLPIILAVANGLRIQGWYHYHRITDMGRPSFEDTDVDVGNLGQACSDAQPRSTSTDNDKVVLMLEEVLDRAQCRQIGVGHD
jgi:hypothetical protein